MSVTVRHCCGIALVAATVFFANLGGATLWDDDEPRNAQCAQEMLARGDAIVPTFNQELRTDKPVLLYWLMMGAYQVLGVSEFSARFWSALLAVGTCLVTYALGCRLVRPAAGFWAALAMATCLMFGVTGRAATPDSALIFLTALALWAYAALVLPSSRPGTRAPLRAHLPVWGAMGLAVLAKGPVGVVLPLGVLVVFWWLELLGNNPPQARQHDSWQARALRLLELLVRPGPWLRGAWQVRPIAALLVVLAVALPWYVAVGFQTDGKWLAGFLGKHNLDRFLAPMERHGGPFFYYLPAVIIGFFPWSVFFPVAVIHLARNLRRASPLARSYRFLASWAGGYLVSFSCAGTKLPSYLLPAYPALALLTGATLDSWLRRSEEFRWSWLRAAWISTSAVGLGLAIGLPIVAHFLLPGEHWLALVGAAPLVGGGWAWWCAARDRRDQAVAAFAAAAAVLAVSLLGWGAGRVSRHQNSPSLIAAARRIAGPQAMLVTHGYTVPSLVFYADQRIPAVNAADALLQHYRSQPQTLLLTTSRKWDRLREQLPSDLVVLEQQRRFLRREDVLLVGRPPRPASGTAQRAHQPARVQ
jgi:4-amino-4-deoxy-L-arabinose transferase-like glycosyltransferase